MQNLPPEIRTSIQFSVEKTDWSRPVVCGALVWRESTGTPARGFAQYWGCHGVGRTYFSTDLANTLREAQGYLMVQSRPGFDPVYKRASASCERATAAILIFLPAYRDCFSS